MQPRKGFKISERVTIGLFTLPQTRGKSSLQIGYFDDEQIGFYCLLIITCEPTLISSLIIRLSDKDFYYGEFDPGSG